MELRNEMFCYVKLGWRAPTGITIYTVLNFQGAKWIIISGFMHISICSNG